MTDSMIGGFGLAFPRREGGVVHPDDPLYDPVSDEDYIKQARAYLADIAKHVPAWEAPEDVWFSRKELLEQIKARCDPSSVAEV